MRPCARCGRYDGRPHCTPDVVGLNDPWNEAVFDSRHVLAVAWITGQERLLEFRPEVAERDEEHQDHQVSPAGMAQEKTEVGQAIEVEIRGQLVAAELVKTPFYSRK